MKGPRMSQTLETTERIEEGPIRVLLVDDHDLFRTGLRNLLEEQGVEIVGEAGDGLQAVTQVRVDDSLASYVLAIVRETRESEQFSLGVSPRGSQMLYRAGQAMAFLDGRNFCVPEDFKPLAVAVFAHRVAVSGRYSSTVKKSEQAEQLLQEIVESVRVPV